MKLLGFGPRDNLTIPYSVVYPTFRFLFLNKKLFDQFFVQSWTPLQHFIFASNFCPLFKISFVDNRPFTDLLLRGSEFLTEITSIFCVLRSTGKLGYLTFGIWETNAIQRRGAVWDPGKNPHNKSAGFAYHNSFIVNRRSHLSGSVTTLIFSVDSAQVSRR